MGSPSIFAAVASLCLAVALLAEASPAGGAEAAAGGDALACRLLSREGRVEVGRKGTSQWTVGETNQVLQPGDRLRTGLRSRATLRWSDLSVLRVDELTDMEIQPPAKADDKPQLNLRSGATYWFSRERPSSIRFRTPAASGAIRGTEFNLAVTGTGRTELSLLDGEVDLANAQGESALKSGEQAIVEPGRAPTRTALLEAVNVIQWALYYPAVLDPAELGLGAQEQETLTGSLRAYRSGDLPQALQLYPEGRQPATDPERTWLAALLLAAGRAEQTEATLKALPARSPAANALREVIAAVKHQGIEAPAAPATASEWMARSYFLQSRSQLKEALQAAREAAKKSPQFGATWVRVAELEFSFGRTPEALAALHQGLALSPRHAQGLALKGFLLAAQNQSAEALEAFNQAIAADGALANAWLGRGLTELRAGQARKGREDLQVAATLDPQRAVLRSYLGKAFSQTRDTARAEKELALAKKLDPNDPTAWLYSALLHEEANRVNEAVSDLEQSKALNDNRSLFRSRLLLDQDQAVRSANLAAIYRDAGLFDFSVQEAARAVNSDYGNYSAHLFLANSYDALRDPKLINLRYETPWYSELLVANLLAPAGGGALSRNISQQEYSRFFDADHLGVISSTEYLSSGDWVQSASQYGILGNTGYSVDAYYRTENGQRPNNDLEQLNLAARFKQQLTSKDSVFFEASYFDAELGDVAQYYSQTNASQTLRVTEKQEPNLLLGYHREWAPGSHTLFLAGRFDDTLTLKDSDPALLYLQTFVNPFTGRTNVSFDHPPTPIGLDYESDLVAYSAELQQIWQTPAQTLIAGARYQAGWSDTSVDLTRPQPGGFPPQTLNQDLETDLDRLSVYAYENWQILEPLRLTAGLSYDRLHYPVNIDTAPITDREDTTDQFSPKAGVVWTPWKDTNLRGVYTRSLGGLFFDTSVRLEPTQIAGFSQAYRSLIPESVIGLVPGTRFETWGAALDQTIKQTGTYLLVQGELLNSDATRTVGMLINGSPAPIPDSPSSTSQELDYREKSLVLAVNQLLGKEWALGARYRLTEADLEARFVDIPASVPRVSDFNQDVSATLHQVYLYALYQHRCGFFGQFGAVWSQQSNRGYSPDRPGDDFWQYNVYLGYRFLRRHAEARLGVLNLTDRDYRLNPLTLYAELPRERTLAASFRFSF